jgi:hypothetical protein
VTTHFDYESKSAIAQSLLSANPFLLIYYARINPGRGFGAGMTEETREVRGRIPKELKIAFEIACARLEVTQTAALEEAIKDWLKKQESASGDK